MTFLTFFLYYSVSALILQCGLIGFFLIKKQFKVNKLKKDIASGKIKVVTMDDILNEIVEQEGKKTWN